MQRQRGEKNRMGKTRDHFRKIRDTKGTFQAKMVSIKDRNGMDLTEAEDIKKRWQYHTTWPASPITSWQIVGETMETVTDFILEGSKITADGDCSHEIKRHLPLGRKARQHIKKQRHYIANKGPSSQSLAFSSSPMYGCESWTMKKAECQRIDVFEL